MAPSLKIKSYDAGEESNIRYAYQDGYLNESEAEKLLLDKGLAENGDDAYWKIQKWNSATGTDETYSRYNRIIDAVRNNGDFDSAMDELTSHGYDEDEVLKNIKSKIGDLYKNGEISANEASNILKKYVGMDEDDIESTVSRWRSKAETGTSFGDIKDEYLNGNLTEEDAVDMYVEYGGYEREKAEETIRKWEFEKESGFSYDEKAKQFKDGNITGSELKNILMEIGGKTKEEAEKDIVSYCRDAYEDGDFSRNDAYSNMTRYGGLTGEEAESKLQYLDIKAKFPDTYVDDAWVDEYYSEIESSGLSMDVFFDYRNRVKGIKGDGKKEKRMEVINSLPISSAQKDAIYLAEGWAESRLSEAPWH